jgi:hypothetical protein
MRFRYSIVAQQQVVAVSYRLNNVFGLLARHRISPAPSTMQIGIAFFLQITPPRK